jgi:ketosteroid isomerase-like protein
VTRFKSPEAFRRRDFAALERAMRLDVVIDVPGSSWLAGVYRGSEEAGRYILALRYVLDPSEKRITFLHGRSA